MVIRKSEIIGIVAELIAVALYIALIYAATAIIMR